MIRRLSIEEQVDHLDQTGEWPKIKDGWADYDRTGMFFAEYVTPEKRRLQKARNSSPLDVILDGIED